MQTIGRWINPRRFLYLKKPLSVVIFTSSTIQCPINLLSFCSFLHFQFQNFNKNYCNNGCLTLNISCQTFCRILKERLHKGKKFEIFCKESLTFRNNKDKGVLLEICTHSCFHLDQFARYRALTE